jgi:hypothetical protein
MLTEKKDVNKPTKRLKLKTSTSQQCVMYLSVITAALNGYVHMKLSRELAQHPGPEAQEDAAFVRKLADFLNLVSLHIHTHTHTCSSGLSPSAVC